MSNETEWVLVPREPSEAMLSAAHYELAYKPFSNNAERSARAYAAMLAAAPQPPAEAQPCGCGEATCTVPWEPGCGLGKSEQHAVVQAQSVGEVLSRIEGKLREAGARLPAPPVKGTIESAVVTGLSIALAVVEAEAPPRSAPVGVEAALRDALQGLIDFIEIDNLPMDADAMFIAKRALAQQPAADTVTVQQAWEWAGGNPGIKATRTDLEQALRDLDAVCDAADTQPTPPAQGFDAEVMWTDAHALLARFVDALNVRGNMLTCDHDRLTALDADARKLITAAAKGVE